MRGCRIEKDNNQIVSIFAQFGQNRIFFCFSVLNIKVLFAAGKKTNKKKIQLFSAKKQKHFVPRFLCHKIFLFDLKNKISTLK